MTRPEWHDKNTRLILCLPETQWPYRWQTAGTSKAHVNILGVLLILEAYGREVLTVQYFFF